jgi:ABC-type branched-subunit amino acid transport system ATPase component
MASDVALTPEVQRPRIHVRSAVKSFGGRVVVNIDDLVMGEHPIEGLLGPNGAGKTTLMRMVMHSIPLDSGTVTLREADGKEVVLSSLHPDHMARHGVVKSNQVIMDFDKLTIWDSVLLPVTAARYERPYSVFAEGTVFREHEEEIRHYLDYFGFEDPSDFALSAGEKKLLDIVRGLLLKPSFLLLDEPTAGLPEDLTEKVMGAIRELAAKGTSVVIVEHDLDVIWSLCDWVHFMAEGELVLSGDPDTIREHRTVVEKYLGEGHV